MVFVNRWRMQGAALCRPAHVAAAAAAAVRHVHHRADPTLLRRCGQRPCRTGLRRLPAALLAGAAVAGRQFCRLAVRHHLEPPVVPGLPVELHAGAGPADAGAGQAWGAQDRGPCCRIAHAADRHSVRAAAGLGGLAGADLPVHQCPARRLVPAREVRDGVPRRLPVWPRARVLGSSGRPAPHHAVAGACRSRLVHGPAHPRPGAAGRLAAASVARSFLGPAGPDQPVAVRLDRAAGHPRLGQGLPRPPVPLAAVLHRGDLSLVHAAPEPDHRAVVLAQAAAAWRVDRAGAAARRHRGRLPADPRAADPSRALAAAAVRPAAEPLLGSASTLGDAFHRELTHQLGLGAVLQPHRDHLVLLLRRAPVRGQAQHQGGRTGHQLLAAAEVVRLHLVPAGLGVAQRELLRAVATGEVLRHLPALVGQAVAIVRALAVRVGHPQVHVAVVGIPGQHHAQVQRHRLQQARVDARGVQHRAAA
ncbi:hypothetical protein G6F31_013466 [Rhizopus arrhizus]|nr:hypothetical protein G6F31_013466 [Rhizopus arrhizus]